MYSYLNTWFLMVIFNFIYQLQLKNEPSCFRSVWIAYFNKMDVLLLLYGCEVWSVDPHIQTIEILMKVLILVLKNSYPVLKWYFWFHDKWNYRALSIIFIVSIRISQFCWLLPSTKNNLCVRCYIILSSIVCFLALS